MSDRRDIKLPEPLADDLAEYKGEKQSWPVFVRETLLPILAEHDGKDPRRHQERQGLSSGVTLAEQLNDVEAAAKEATEAAQSAEQAVDELAEGRR